MTHEGLRSNQARIDGMIRRYVAALLLALSVIAAGCAPTDAGQEADEDSSASPSPTMNENRNPDDGY